MKNRIYARRKKNGKFWCSHVWEVAVKVGPDWDLRVGVKILCKCSVCGKLKYFSNRSIKEIPDELIDMRIRYI